MGERLASILMISEIRTIAADDLWMSPCYRQPCVGIHFTCKPDPATLKEMLPLIEHELAPFEPRPHWGKIFTMPPEAVQARYPKLSDFRALVHEFDPAGKFRNAFIERYLFDS